VRSVIVAGLILASPYAALGQANPVASLPSDQEIRQILIDRIDRDRQSVGIVVGVIEPTGRRVISYGRLDRNDGRQLDGETFFEIGSITKVFTSLLLADMVQRGEVALDNPIARYLPAGTTVPERGGRQITLVDLATHTSGLPRLPTNMTPKDLSNPYADYTVDQMYRLLGRYELPRDIGATFEYSNLGAGLLGHGLARRAEMDYEALVKARITEPLGMASTTVRMSADQQSRFAVGHDAQLAPVPNWDVPALAGAGALRSTANDLLVFLAAHLGTMESTLAPAMAAMTSTRRPTGLPGLDIALGWQVLSRNGRSIIFHNGGTGGSRSFIGYDPSTRAGVVVLSNAFTLAGVDDIGLHLLDVTFPLLPPPRTHTEIEVDPRLWDGYVGRYELAPDFILTITREGDRLYVQATGQQRFELFAEAATGYFVKEVDAQLTFEVDGAGRATGLVLHQGGQNTPAKRIEDR
jgi:D-alanyl-D-alanine-carboxypeptidase/D-alanyl-D-alanine-endopeptidase